MGNSVLLEKAIIILNSYFSVYTIPVECRRYEMP